METQFYILLGALIIAFLWWSYLGYKKREIISAAKSHGILKRGEHYKVYKVYRSSSYTSGGAYTKNHNVHDFKEILLVSAKNEKIFITEKQLFYCLKVRKHSGRREEDGKMTNKWAEWRIDPNGDDEIGLSKNDIYLGLY